MANIDQIKAEVLQALSQQYTAAHFACAGPVPDAPNPGLIINDLGVIGFPLSQREAQAVVSKCRKSPVGKGTKTLLDDSIRKSYELNPSQFVLANPSWHDCIGSLLSKIYTELGLTCGRTNVKAELYKLLVYEQGAFFKSHQDSEKTPGMFGTLVVSLPSEHKGGQVILTHNKTEHIFDSSMCPNPLIGSTSFGAWYSNVYHEVRPVTSGYRVVLTYNLVQDTKSVRQMASDGTSEARLQAAFQLWETGLKEEIDNEYPPYLLHKLEHMYSKNSLNLNTLKGNDFSTVQLLNNVCQRLNADIYLATYEKAVEKDDECDDEVFGREEDIRFVTTLDGQQIDVRPDYDASYFLEDYDPENEEDSDWDESEHEGYTGNEGSPATYWYRDTIVMIVPPSRRLVFSLSGEDKWSIVYKRLPALRQKAAGGNEAKEELQQYCELIVASRPESSQDHMYFSTWSVTTGKERQRQACLDLAASITLENGWMGMFRRLPAEPKRKPDAIRLLGHYICLHSGMNIESELRDIIQCGKGIADKHHILREISSAFEKASPSTEQQQWFEKCCKAVVKQVINQSSGLSGADMSALAAIARTFGIETVSPLIMSLPSEHTQNLTEFVLGFTKQNEALSNPDTSRICQEIMDKLWHGFQYTSVQQQAMLPTVLSYPGIAPRPRTVLSEGLTTGELTGLLTIAKANSSDELLDALGDMTKAVAKANSRYVSEQLMDFVKAILAHEVPPLMVEDNPEIYDSVSKYISTVLHDVIVRWIGPQPQKPANWCLPHKGCGSSRCADCQHVAKFMSNPVQKSLENQVRVKRCTHLDYYFGGKYGDGAQCTTQIDQQKKPYTWKCTKVHKVYNEQLKTWTKRRTEVQAKLSRMGGKNGERLRIYLGDKTDAFLTCRVEDLPGSEDGLPLEDLHTSALNVKNSKKRKADRDSGEYGSAFQAKRMRGTSIDIVEISD